MRKLNNTWFLRGNPHGKNHGLISEPQPNLESTKWWKLQPNPGMSEPSLNACDLSNLIPDATHKTYFLYEENNTLSEYMNIQMQHRARETLYAYLRWWICN